MADFTRPHHSEPRGVDADSVFRALSPAYEYVEQQYEIQVPLRVRSLVEGVVLESLSERQDEWIVHASRGSPPRFSDHDHASQHRLKLSEKCGSPSSLRGGTTRAQGRSGIFHGRAARSLTYFGPRHHPTQLVWYLSILQVKSRSRQRCRIR